jgi:flavodoxin
MKTLIIYYSYTGNNAKLAKAISNKLNADCIELKETRKRTTVSILLDIVFNRIPKIQNIDRDIIDYEYIIFVAPIWFGKIGTPLRRAFQKLKNTNQNISLVTLSAGYDGINSKSEKEIVKRTGITPKALINPLLSELFSANPKPTRKTLEEYKISQAEAEKMAEKIVENFEI